MAKTKVIHGFEFTEYFRPSLNETELIGNSAAFFDAMDQRRSVRDFSDKPVPRQVIDNLLRTASTAPSGAHKQPWTFCVVSDPVVKSQIRMAAEKEEQENYNGRMSDQWINDLKPLQTDWRKEFLEIAPYLIVVFKRIYEFDVQQNKLTNYYVQESVGIACGFLLAAVHLAGLAALPHTPSPMNFLCKILRRPENEKPFLLVPVGYPSGDCYVPRLRRKSLEEIAVYL